MQTLYIVLAAATVLVWIPALIKFFRTWMTRRNPISLAICCAIALIMWESVGHIWIVTGAIDSTVAVVAFTSVAAAVGVYFNLSFIWAKKRFPNERR